MFFPAVIGLIVGGILLVAAHLGQRRLAKLAPKPAFHGYTMAAPVVGPDHGEAHADVLPRVMVPISGYTATGINPPYRLVIEEGLVSPAPRKRKPEEAR
jgi:hypothetical protein